MDVVELFDGKDIWNIWIKSRRKGNTGIGKTFEDVIGVRENNSKGPDWRSTEFKTHRSKSSSLVTLGTLTPSFPVHPMRTLIENYGTLDGNKKKLYNSISSTRTSVFQLKFSDARLAILHDESEICGWEKSVITSTFGNKLQNMAVVQADTKFENGSEFFRFRGADLHYGFRPDNFMKMASTGKIEVHFRAKITNGKLRDHGTAFRTECTNIPSLYNTTVSFTPKTK